LGYWKEYVRKAACEALEKLGEGRLAKAIIGALSGDVEAREELRRLATQGDVRAVEPLIEQLGKSHFGNSDVSKAACEALVAIGPVSVEPLIKRLGDKDYCVPQAACDALGQLGDVRAVEPLIKELGNQYFYVSKARCKALNSIYKTVKPRMKEMLCGAHFTRFKRNTYKVDEKTAYYVACRICDKVDQVMFGVREIIAILDMEMEGEFLCTDDIARINWLKFGNVFDFERVEIVQASDYDVERFCVQVGNDMDKFRRRRYRKMSCVVAPQCDLSENTINILRSMFGDVSVESSA